MDIGFLEIDFLSKPAWMWLAFFAIVVSLLAACRTEGLVLVGLRFLRGLAGLDMLGSV